MNRWVHIYTFDTDNKIVNMAIKKDTIFYPDPRPSPSETDNGMLYTQYADIFVPENIRLNNEILRYFNPIEIFEKFKTIPTYGAISYIDMMVDECAINEEYRKFINDSFNKEIDTLSDIQIEILTKTLMAKLDNKLKK